MRIWSLHPKHLDTKGLVALWRETLLAQSVLRGKTRAYTNHPQLIRFKECSDPIQGISNYLHGVHHEALRRDYKFSASKIILPFKKLLIMVSVGQIEYEWKHLQSKLLTRDTKKYYINAAYKRKKCHPIFILKKGDIAKWEKVKV